MRGTERDITLDRVKQEAERFLRKRFLEVRRLRITHFVQNARNPQRNMWQFWGSRMIRVWAEAEVSPRRLAPLTRNIPDGTHHLDARTILG